MRNANFFGENVGGSDNSQLITASVRVACMVSRGSVSLEHESVPMGLKECR